MGLIEKTYNPYRLRTPMKRTYPRKGRDEDPGFVSIPWDEALDTIASRLIEIRRRGVVDDGGLPRIAASFGHGGTPQSYMGTFPAFLSAWGVVDYSFGSGQGVKCVHSEHLYGEFWHRGFTVAADTRSYAATSCRSVPTLKFRRRVRRAPPCRCPRPWHQARAGRAPSVGDSGGFR